MKTTEVSSVGGIFTFEHRRNNVAIDTWSQHNLVPAAGINKILDTALGGVTAISPWYVTLFSNTYTPQDDDLYVHIGSRYTEVVAVDGVSRPDYTLDGVAVAGLITNSSNRASFVFNADTNVAGGMIVSNSTKGDNSSGPIMVAASAHSPIRNMKIGDELLVRYEFQMTST